MSEKKADSKPDSLASNSNSSGGRTRRPSASRRKIQIDFDDDDDKPASDVKVSTESHPVNDKALTIKEIPPEAKDDANSSPPEKAVPPVAPSTGGGRTKRTLKVKKKLVESSDDDDSDFDGGTEDDSDDDEFAPPAKKKVCKTAPGMVTNSIIFMSFFQSRIILKKCVFDKPTINVSRPGTSVPRRALLMVILFICCSGNSTQGEGELEHPLQN